MKYGIGLDCGINSVGYCIMELNSDDEPKRIVRLNSRIFTEAENPKDGSSLAAPRREARGLRRRIRRHKHRLERIRALLVRENIVTQAELDNMFSGTLSDIYELRTAALDAPLNNIEFARVLINLAQRRGFKSNRKSEKSSSDKETGKLLSAIEKNKESIEAGGYRTVGEMLFKDERYAKHKRNKGEAYLNTVSRDMIEAEIHAVFASQRNFGMPFASEKIENEYTDIALSQRPFDLGPGEGPENCKSPYAGKQIKNMIGQCTFFPEEKRAVKASYSFQLFSLLQGINNITLVSSDGNTFPLSQEQRKTLKDYCFKTANVTYASIRKVLQIPQEYTFKNITYTDDGIEKSEKKTKFQHLKPYHEMKKVLGSAIQTLTPKELDEIGEIFTFYKDETIIIKQLEETEIDKSLYDLLLQLPTFEKAGHISTKACKMIIPFLEEGKTYDKACECAGLNFKAHSNMQKQMLLPAKSDELNDVVNPVVRRAISQTIKVVNAIIREMGTSPTYINIELARELSKSKKERDEINKKYKLNQAENERLKNEIIDNFKIKPNGQDIIKLKLWHEQDDGICPYTGVRIKYENLFDDGYAEIDHIIPYSLSFDDSFNNKILTTATQNRQKGNRIPLEYLPESEKDGFRVWVNSNIQNHRKRQNLLKEHFTEADKKEFKSRNLNDTRYLNKLLLNYINNNLLFTDFYNGKKKHVTSVNGAVTAYIRKRWGINKNREDGDLHHAVDAAVIACVTQGIINRITAYSARNEAPYDLNTETGEIKERFPLPYPNFKKELDARTTIEDEKRLKRVLMSFSNYSYDDVEKAKPCFVSRTPHRKVTGAAHEETIRSGKVEGFTVSKTELTKLKLTNGEIEGYYEPESDTLLYNALLQRLNEFGGDAKAAFADEFHKPKADGTPGPVVKKVKTIKRSSSNVKARNKNGLGVADNGSMIRIDVFYVENEGYYFVPIYVADTVKEMPNEACPFGKDKKKIMTDDDFLFSLYPNDLIKITAKKDKEFNLVYKESGLPKKKYANEALVYFIKAGITKASITIETHDGAYSIPSCGIKSLVKLEKYTVDPLGNVSKVNREKRMYFK